MKKLFALALVVLGLAACQTEPNELDVNVGGEVLTTVNISIPETTRATDSAEGAFVNGVLDGDATIRYILQVYYNGQPSKERLVQYSDGKSVAFDVRLVSGRKYQFVAWADVVDGENAGDKHYDTSDLTNIKLNGEWNAMDETRDAFTATQEFTYGSTATIDLTLKRPFAKLRVKTTDMKALYNIGIMPKKATVVYNTDHRAAFNAFTGEAKSVEYAKVSDKEFVMFDIKDYEDNVTNESKILFTDYFFAENDVVKFDLTVYDQNGEVIGETIAFNTDINVKRNHLTTISGNILTDRNNVNVTIKDVFEGNENWPDNNAEDLAYVAIFGGEVTLTDNVTLTEPLTIAEGANAVINLNGKTISNATGYAVENYGKLTISGNGAVNGMGGIRSHGGEVTINGGTYTGASKWNEGTYQHILKAENTKVVINGGTFDATIQGTNNAMINVSENSVVTINGGEFRNVVDGEVIPQFAPYMFTYEKNGKLIINDGDFYGGWRFNGETTTTDIYGGNFTVSYDGQSFHANSTHVLTVYGGTFSLENGGKLNPTNYCAAGHYALQYETGKYTVQAFDATSRTLTINSKEDLLKLPILNEKWKEFFSNGQGTDITDFWTQNGGKGADFYYKWTWTIKLNADIDFEDATLTAPINVDTFGCFDGQNHTIKNVNIVNNTGAGLFVASSTKLQNINLDSINVTAGYGGNSTAGILACDCNGGIDKITISNSSVVGGKYTGGVVGYGYTYVTNCTLTDCVVKGGYKCGGVIGYICASNATGHNVTGNTLTGCTVEAAPQHADGKSEYVLGKVVGNYNCNGTCADNVVYDMTTTATKIIGKIEAGMVVNESDNDVTCVVENYNELKSAVTEENATVNVAAGDYTFPSSVAAGVTINCEEGTVFTGTSGLNINGATVIGAEFKNENGVAVSGTINGTFKNCTFTGYEALRWCYSVAGNTTVFENCVIKTDFRGFHYDNMNGDVIFRNCEINGFNAYGGDGTVTFEGCTFGCDESRYNGLNIYSNTKLVNCTFNYVSGKTNFIDMEGTGKTLTITNCTATLDGANVDIKNYVGGSKLADNKVVYN